MTLIDLTTQTVRFALLTLVISGTVTADEYASPEALLAQMQRLQSQACDLAGNITLAEMYSDEFLNNLRQVVMLGLENEEYRENNLQIFFGEQDPLEELRAMSAGEFFARQTWHKEKSAQPGWLMKTIELKSQEAISANEIRTIVVRSGMQADPKYKEEGFMTFIKVGDGWKIKH